MTRVAAVDIGATSGRVLVVERTADGLRIDEVHRFPNHPVEQAGAWVWDIDALWAHVCDGVRAAVATGPVASIGIDTWAVDYGVVDDDGRLVGPVYAYRDPWHATGVATADARLAWAEHYGIAGIQRLPFNTVYQLLADRHSQRRQDGEIMLLPDLLMFRATGVRGTELTNASSTALIDARVRRWSPLLLARLGLSDVRFAPLLPTGAVRGSSTIPGAEGIAVVAVATHDTASAYVATPMRDVNTCAVLSLGTWALIGAELPAPILDEAARAANFTNELGVDNTVRFLKNVTGMWLFEECRREWSQRDGREIPVPELLEAAMASPAHAASIDPDDPRFANPGFGAEVLADAAIGARPETRGAIVRCILESVAQRIAEQLQVLERLTGIRRTTLHVVGGGSRIPQMMQWLADATGMQVVAGPVEATALGNAGVQFVANGDFADVAAYRAWLATHAAVQTYTPASLT